MAITKYVKDGGVWKAKAGATVKHLGAWKEVKEEWIKIEGVWTLVYKAPVFFTYSGTCGIANRVVGNASHFGYGPHSAGTRYGTLTPAPVTTGTLPYIRELYWKEMAYTNGRMEYTIRASIARLGQESNNLTVKIGSRTFSVPKYLQSGNDVLFDLVISVGDFSSLPQSGNVAITVTYSS